MQQGKNTGFLLLHALLCLALAPAPACNGGDGNGEPDADAVTEVLPDQDDTSEGTDPTEDTATLQPFGGACGGDAECRDGACFEGACTRPCASFAMCPEAGYRCGDAGDGRALCLLTSFETGDGTSGSNCALGGDADCADGYICMSKSPDDPYAFCTRECADDRQCPTGMHCKALVEGERAYCRPRGYCQRCIIDDECGFAGDKCVADDLGGRFCSQQCSLEGITCPIDSTCTDLGEGVGLQCLPDYDGHRCLGDGELCAPCDTNYDCTNGVCMEDYYTHHKFCTVPCSDPSCPAPDEFYCTTDNQCRPRKGSCSEPSGGGLMCDNCEDLTDCLNGYCLTYPDEYHFVCGEDCSATRTCESVWADCYEITSGSVTVGYNCLPKSTIANCFQYSQCVTYCPDGPTGCDLPFCQL